MIREIIKDYDKLSIRAREAEPDEDLLNDLGDTLHESNLLYLTSNQIGIADKRALALKFNNEVDVFFNPAFIEKGKLIIFREEDELDGKEYFIPRYAEVSLGFQDINGKPKGLKFNEGASVVICRAIDRLNGLQTSDYGLEVLPEFDAASEEDKQEVLAAYIESLHNSAGSLDTELSSNSETKTSWNAYKFISSVASGETKLAEPEMSNRKKKRLAKFLKTLKKVK